MDILSHGLWTGAVAKIANNKVFGKRKRQLKLWEAIIWGVFPDVLAFIIPFVWIVFSLISDHMNLIDVVSIKPAEPTSSGALSVFFLSSILYHFGHSLIIFLAVFTISSLLFRRPIWEMAGWLFHILLDIPTHGNSYPAPFLWPMVNVGFNGVPWKTPWLLLLNYVAIILTYFYLHKRKLKNIIKI